MFTCLEEQLQNKFPELKSIFKDLLGGSPLAHPISPPPLEPLENLSIRNQKCCRACLKNGSCNNWYLFQVQEKELSFPSLSALHREEDRDEQREMKRSYWHGSRDWLGFIICFVYICESISQVSASIHEYKNEPFTVQSNAFFFHGGSEGLYASNEGRSFIRFESIIFVRTKESSDKQNEMQTRTGSVEAIIVEVKDKERIGGAFLKSDAICCNPELSKDRSCKVGEVIIDKKVDNPEWPKRIQTFFEGKSQEAKMDMLSVEINNTGMYYLYFMFCDPFLNGTVIRGSTVWRNPEGYLPGKMVPLMTFYGIMSLVYLALGLMWFLRFVQFWKDIIQLHYHITAVIALGMCETALWYFEYANLNATGSRPMGITLLAVTITAVKKTLSRLLLLVVSMGYGVVKPTLGGLTSRVLLLGVIYFIASEALDLVDHLGNINDLSQKARVYVALPVVFLDAWFILWIFSSLSKTLEKLQMRRSMAKLELYRKFTNSLAIFVLLSIAWIGYELYFNASDPLSELWRIAWIIPAFWTLLAFSLLVVICVLWAPSSNPTRYAYSAGDDYDEEAISLTSSGVKVAGETDQVTVLREDLEEDKRE